MDTRDASDRPLERDEKRFIADEQDPSRQAAAEDPTGVDAESNERRGYEMEKRDQQLVDEAKEKNKP